MLKQLRSNFRSKRARPPSAVSQAPWPEGVVEVEGGGTRQDECVFDEEEGGVGAEGGEDAA